LNVKRQKGDSVAKVKRPIKEEPGVHSDGQDQQARAFPPLRDETPSPEETEAFRNETFDRYHEVLTKLADS
jgi:hypothetical protein